MEVLGGLVLRFVAHVSVFSRAGIEVSIIEVLVVLLPMLREVGTVMSVLNEEE
jgi:hypothetical protein